VKIIRDSDDDVIEASVCTTGAFDGVHVGHQAVIREVKRRAEARGVASAVVTFDKPPALVGRPESAPKLLTRLERKLELLDELGVDVVYVIEFGPERAATTAQEFVDEVFVGRLGTREILVGNDFKFGKGREGTVQFLEEAGAGAGFDVEGLDLIVHDPSATEHVSSTAIRRALNGGAVEQANAMLGRPFELVGEVTKGDQRGRTIGFPTANVVLSEDMARPANGVYACNYVLPDGSVTGAAINVGVRPTFYEQADAAVLEAHLLDFPDDSASPVDTDQVVGWEAGNLYGTQARVQFLHFLRSERRFNGIDELKSQLDDDIAVTRTLLAE